MKTVVVYYSYTGSTAKLAEALAQQQGAALCQVQDSVRPGTLKAYTAGCIAAMGQKRTPIEPLDIDLHEYDKVILMAPVWAGQPAPAINNVFDLLPSGKQVELYMVSASGNSKAREKVEALVKEKGCTLIAYQDIKS